MKDCIFKNLCFGKNPYLEIPITVVFETFMEIGCQK
jgi:hypothetical protein